MYVLEFKVARLTKKARVPGLTSEMALLPDRTRGRGLAVSQLRAQLRFRVCALPK